ncbi:MAG: sugar ABC transporter permease [Clostridia bacterium]|nr:sugar ABC transporter permease [Clostridia bacterium]
MKHYSDLEYLKLSKGKKLGYRVASFFTGIPKAIWNFIKKIGNALKGAGLKVADEAKDIVGTFIKGDWKTKVSYLIMGFGCLARGQILRGLLFLLFEIVFVGYMVLYGVYWLRMLPSLGTVGPHEEYNEIYDAYTTTYGDNSFKILLYGVLTIFFIIAFLYTWRVNVKQNKLAEQILRSGKKLKSGKDDLRSLVDDQFHKTLLALPLTGILIFTVMPILFMILVAFTNYDGAHDGYYSNLFTWVGLKNFNTLFSWSSGGVNYAATFGEILAWTLMWAFFATFTNYFLGMIVAMMINKKGIRVKKLWRTILVLTIAIPQFISLLYVSKMFAKNGIVNGFLMNMGWIDKAIDFWGETANHGLLARVTVIVINIWIGIPYLMLIATGILMNIPADLYESAKIDGANAWQQYTKITLPYMLFITGPYLLTSFTGNMNNFNVIYLLTGGAPTNAAASGAAGSVGFTDLLITWLFKITMGPESQYYLASVVGIMVFVVIAVISLIVYNVLPSIKNEEDFQ